MPTLDAVFRQLPGGPRPRPRESSLAGARRRRRERPRQVGVGRRRRAGRHPADDLRGLRSHAGGGGPDPGGRIHWPPGRGGKWPRSPAGSSPPTAIPLMPGWGVSTSASSTACRSRRSKARGAPAAGPSSGSHDILKPGEFLLGYPADDGTVTPGMPVPAALDRQRLLPGAPDAPGMRDFGRNGTYLVFRQLEQDVAAFRRARQRRPAPRTGPPDPAAAAQVGARMVGRWRDGRPLSQPSGDSSHAAGVAATPTSLVSRAIRTASAARSARTSGARIRAIRCCRLDASRWTRRTVTGCCAAAAPTVRRCRTRAGDDERGARAGVHLPQQRHRASVRVRAAELVEQPGFGGLYDERDPLIGTSHDGGGRLTLQANGVRERIDGFGQFVTVKCGGYFFMPGLSALRYLRSLDAPLRAAGRSAGAARTAARRRRRRRHASAAATGADACRRHAHGRFASIWGAAVSAAAGGGARRLSRCVPRWAAGDAASSVRSSIGSAWRWSPARVARRVRRDDRAAPGAAVRLALESRAARGGVTPATWWQIFAFQLLALPVVGRVDPLSALESDHAASRALPATGAVVRLCCRRRVGGAAAIALLMPTTTHPVAPSRLAARAVLPADHRCSRRVGGSGWRRASVAALQPLLAPGALDRRQRARRDRPRLHRLSRRRVLPGHAFAVSLALVVAALYRARRDALSPARCAPDDWLPRAISGPLCVAGRPRAPRWLPALTLLIAAGWLLWPVVLPRSLQRRHVAGDRRRARADRDCRRAADRPSRSATAVQLPLVRQFLGQ